MKLRKVGDKLRVIADEPYVSIADQIKAAVLAERERCAKVCEQVARRWDKNSGCARSPYVPVPQDGCDECATAIRKGEAP